MATSTPTRSILLVTLLLTALGCQGGQPGDEVQISDPVELASPADHSAIDV